MRYLTLALTALVLVSCNRDPNYLKQQYVQRGNDFFKSGRYKEASIMYRKAIEKDRKYGEAYYRLALTNLKEGAGVAAIRPLRVAVELLKPGTPESNDATFQLAEIEVLAAGTTDHNEGIIKEVQGYAAGMLARDPKSWEGHKLNGDLALLEMRKLIIDRKAPEAKKKLEDGIVEIRAALASNPGNYSTSLALARVLELDGETEEAQTILTSLIAREKQNPNAYLELYRLYGLQRKLPEAEDVLKKAIQNNPKDAGLRLELARFYFGTNKRPELIALLDQMKSNLKEFPNAYLQAGDFFQRVNQQDESIKQYEEGIQKDPDKKLTYLKHEVEAYIRANNMPAATAKNNDILKIDSKDPDARAIKATLQLDKGDYNAAMTELQSVVTARPGNYIAHFNLGRAHLARGEVEQARQEFDKAVQIRPDYVLARLAQTQVALLRGDVDGAIRDSDELLRIVPNSVEGRVMKAAALQRQQKFDEARGLLQPVVAQQPNSVPALLELGVLDMQQKKNKDAIEKFHKAYEANPNNINSLLYESRAYLLDGQLDKSVELVATEAQKQPARMDLQQALGNAQLAAGQFPQAIATFQNLMGKVKDPRQQGDLWVRIGQAYRYAGDVQHSIEAFEKSRQSLPDNPAIARDLGMLYEELGRPDSAKKYYETAIKLDSDDAYALNNLAYLITETNGDLNQALSYAQRAKQRLPTFTEVTDTLGWIYLKKNLTDSAIDNFKTLVVQAPQNPVYHYHYAMALNAKGDRDSAKKECQAALANRPNKAQEDQIRQLLSRLG